MNTNDCHEHMLYISEQASLLNSQNRIHGEDKDGAIEENSFPGTKPMRRKIGWSSAYILTISRVIGSGIFAMPGVVVQGAGSPGLALCLWVIGALVALAGLLIGVEYGAMLPRSGGYKIYLEYTYRRPRFLASTLFAIQAILLYLTVTNSIIFAKYIVFATGAELTNSTTRSLAIGLLTIITIIHGCFYKTGIDMQDALGWLKIGLIAFMIVTGFSALFLQQEPLYSRTDLWTDSNLEWSTLCTTFFKVLYSYAGLENVNNVMGEVKNPVRTIKTVGPAALFTACTLYLLINIAYLSVVPLSEIKQSRELIAALFFERLGFGRAFLPTAIALSAAGNVMVVVFSLSRLKQEIARQGFLPYPRLLASNQPFGSPIGGLIVHYVPSMLVILLTPSQDVYSFLAEVEGYTGQIFALAVAIGLITLRYKEPDLYRPFKVWLPTVWLRIGLAIALILSPWLSLRRNGSGIDLYSVAYALVGLSVLLFGCLYWWIWTMLLPRYRGYSLEEASETLPDGTTITRLVKIPI